MRLSGCASSIVAMRAKIIALPVAAGLALGGASLASADDPPPPREPAPVRVAPLERAPVQPAFPPFAEPGPFGLHSDIAEDMAKELNLPQERVVEAMRKAIAAQFDRQRDEALKCFDDRKACEAAGVLPQPAILVPPGKPVPVRPGDRVGKP